MAQLLQNAACGTALILAVALLRQTLKDRLLPGARLLLWALCLLRLLTPVPLESALSLWGLSRLSGPQTQQSVPAPPVHVPDTPDPTVIPVYLPDTPGVSVYIPAADAPAVPTPPASGSSISWGAALLTVWLLVGLVLAVRYALSWRRTRRAVNCTIPVERDDPRYAPLPRCARLREGPMEGAPLTFGAVKPTVVLTPGLEGETLDCVLAHEGIHAQRRDNLWHYAMALALVVHWWNPAVWLMARLLRRDIELSCDRAVVNKLGAERRADYANALLSLATQAKGPAFCHTFGRKAAEERITAIMKYKKATALGLVLSLLLVCGVTVAFATEPVESTLNPDPAASEAAASMLSPVPALTKEALLWNQLQQLIADMEPETKQALGYKSEYAVAQSNCTHPNIDQAELYSWTWRNKGDESGHEFCTYWLRTCPDCGADIRYGNPVIVKEAHSFGPGHYESSDHSAVKPSMHFATYSHVCSICNGSFTYTSRLGCTQYGCIDVQSITPNPAEADLVPAGEDQPDYVDPDSAGISEYVPDDYEVKLPTFDEDGNPILSDAGITGQEFYNYEFITDSSDVAEPTSDSSISPDLRDAIQDQWEARIQEQVADWLATHAGSTSVSTSSNLSQYPVRTNCYPETHHADGHH